VGGGREFRLAEREHLMKARDVAAMLSLEVDTLLDHFQRGDVPGYRLYGRKGGPVRFRLSEVERWLNDVCRVGEPPPVDGEDAETGLRVVES
jgi:hypothetical protein